MVSYLLLKIDGLKMPKMKTNSSAKKRFKKTGGKKIGIKRAKAYRRHLKTKKNAKVCRQLRSATLISESDKRGILKLLPY